MPFRNAAQARVCFGKLKKKSSGTKKVWNCYKYLHSQEDYRLLGGETKNDAAGALCKITRLRKAQLISLAESIGADSSGTIKDLCASIRAQINKKRLDPLRVYQSILPVE